MIDVQQPQIVKGALLENIAVLRLSALGDVVMMVPTIRSLQKSFPKTPISWIISRPMHALVEGMDGVDFIVVDKPRSIGDYLQLRRQFKSYRFDVLLAAQSNLRVNLMLPFIKSTCRVGFDNERSREGHHWFVDRQVKPRCNHILESFMQFAFALGVTQPEMRWDLPIAEADFAYAREVLGQKPYVAINPCASKVDRNWSIENNVKLIRAIHERWQRPVVLTGGGSDVEQRAADAICAQVETDCLNLVGQTSLKQLAAVLSQVDAMVSPDTGPLHLAVAMNTPVVGLYADITPALSGPYEYQDLVVDRYAQALKQFRKKDANQVPWITRVHDVRAMQLITVDDVMQQLEKVLSND